MGGASGLMGSAARLWSRLTRRTEDSAASAHVVRTSSSPGATGLSQTVQITPPRADGLLLSYRPDWDGDPDAGEVVWTWVPYAEYDGRGKDRPVLVIGREDQDRVYAVRMTSTAHPGDPDYVSLGSGEWDSRGRASWVDVSRIYSVHRDGMRREAAALDLDRFVAVANTLRKRYGWDAARA
ncbi:type II toxin-antitoxin system PemK/MazF family toxin [Microbacterium sediminicola]|uniref:Type II toxin-antitoxin system PemK/MazF family toxin n=1 Tax=Microbacterium sediminicola TaxID=415210 RepID=A0ABN2HTE4_9MICO